MRRRAGLTAAESTNVVISDRRDVSFLISLVVATLGRTNEFGVMLDSMKRQTEKRFEIIVVDQNPDDRLVPIIEEKRSAYFIIRHVRQSSHGVCKGRNAGLALAQAPIVAFPDDDCWYEPDTLATALSYFADNLGIAGIVGHWVEFDPDRRRRRASLDPRLWRSYKGGEAPAFCLFFRTEELHKIGGFSEYLGPGSFFGCAEEEDLILRFLQANARIDYLPTADIHHSHSDAPPFTGAQRHRNRLYGRGMGAVLAKHRFPLWIVVRGLAGPVYHALRAPNKGVALLLSAYSVVGRVEGLVAWWLGRHRPKKAAR